MQDHHILARKYADRWLRKVLNEGLFGRPMQRVEVPQDKPLIRALTLGAYQKSAESKVCQALVISSGARKAAT